MIFSATKRVAGVVPQLQVQRFAHTFERERHFLYVLGIERLVRQEGADEHVKAFNMEPWNDCKQENGLENKNIFGL
jgi:hypothetical protein